MSIIPLPQKRVWLDPGKSSQALANCLDQPNIIEDYSPRTLAQAIKNEAELNGLRQCHIRDAAALVRFLGKYWTHTTHTTPETENFSASSIRSNIFFFLQINSSSTLLQVSFFAWLEEYLEIGGSPLTELTAADKLEGLRR